jgi:hypothetical protein
MSVKSLRHKFSSGVIDGADATQVRPSNWNDDHNLWLGIEAQSATTYTFNNDDHLSLVTFSNLLPIAAALPTPSVGGNFISGWMCFARNLGAGAVTITPTTSTIDASASLTLRTGQSAAIFSDGANYFTLPMVGPGSGTFVSSLGAVTTSVNIGTSAAPFGDLFLKSTGKLDFGSGNASIVHTPGGFVFNGGATFTGGVTYDSTITAAGATINGPLSVNGTPFTHTLANDSILGPGWIITHDRPIGVTNDILHNMVVKGRNAAGAMVEMARTDVVNEDAAGGHGRIRWNVAVGNALTSKLVLSGSSNTLAPAVAGGLLLGVAALPWAGLHLANNSSLNFGTSVVATHTLATNTLAFTGNVTFANMGTSGALTVGTVGADADLTVNGSTINQTIDGNVGAELVTTHVRPAGVAGDRIWSVTSHGRDAGGAPQPYTMFESVIGSAVNAAEAGMFRWQVAVGGTLMSRMTLIGTALSPYSDAVIGLGTSAIGWKNLYLSANATVIWGGSDITLTHSLDKLTFTGGTYEFVGDISFTGGSVSFASLLVPGTTELQGATTISAPLTLANQSFFHTVTGGTMGAVQTATLIKAPNVANDVIYKLDAYGRDSGNAAVYYASFEAGVSTAGLNTETGFFRWSLSTAGGINPKLLLVTDALMPNNDNELALGIVGLGWKGLQLSVSSSIVWGSSDVSIVHTPNALAFAGAAGGYSFDAALLPVNDNAVPLGSASKSWSDLNLGTGALINFGTPTNVYIQHGADTLLFFGTSAGIKIDGFIGPISDGGAALGSPTNRWNNLYMSALSQIRFGSDDVLINHTAANTLAFQGATPGGYLFDGDVKPSTSGAGMLGTSALLWNGLHLSSGSAINFANDLALTHTSNTLTLGGGNFAVDGNVIVNSTVAASFFHTVTTSGALGPAWTFKLDKAAGLVNDTCFWFDLQGPSSTGINRSYGIMEVLIETNSNGFEDGMWRWRCITDGLSRSKMILSAKEHALMPAGNVGVNELALGTTVNRWQGLYLDNAGLINFNNGDMLISYTANKLTVSGGAFDVVGTFTVNDGDFTITTGSGVVNTVGNYQVDGTKVVGNRIIGWATPGGTQNRTNFVTYTAPAVPATYTATTQSNLQGVCNHVEILSQRMCALLIDLMTHGLIGATVMADPADLLREIADRMDDGAVAKPGETPAPKLN